MARRQSPPGSDPSLLLFLALWDSSRSDLKHVAWSDVWELGSLHVRSLTGVPRLVLDPKRSPYRIFLIGRRCGLQVFAGERLFPQKDFHFEECDENHREVGAQGTVGKISNGIHCLRPILLTPATISQRDDHFCGRLSVYSYCYESGAVSLDSSSFILGGESIRKFDFWIGIFLSGTSGSIQKSTSGSIRIYPKKSGTSGLLHHSSKDGNPLFISRPLPPFLSVYHVSLLQFPRPSPPPLFTTAYIDIFMHIPFAHFTIR